MHSHQRKLENLADLYLSEPAAQVNIVRSPGDSPSRRSHRPDLALQSAYAQSQRPICERDSVAPPDRLRLVPGDVKVDEYHLENRLAEELHHPVPLMARCPHEWRARMMVDGAGRIHLWRGQVDHDAHVGIVSLINARFWVRENIQLIAMTQPECGFDLGAEPMLHVFISDQAKAGVLDGMLGPYLRVHVLPGRPAAPAEQRSPQRRPA
jgi:hypothetical protein